MKLNREHDVMLYKIIQKIRKNQKLDYDEIGVICMIRWRLDTIDFVKSDDRECGIICDIAGKLVYIERYMKGVL